MADIQKNTTKALDDAEKAALQQRMRKGLREARPIGCDPDNVIEDFVKALNNNKSEKNKKTLEELNRAWNAALPVVSLDTHYELANSVGERIMPLVIEFARELIVEYDCKTVSEKALAEVVVSAYARILECSKSMQDIALVKYPTNSLNGLYEIISKELDRANRHFITSLATLRQIKSPTMEIKVRAHTAIIGNNQQFNTTQAVEPLKADYEINSPK